MKNLKRFGFVLFCAMVLGTMAFGAVDPNAVNNPSWLIDLIVTDTSDEEFSTVLKDLSIIELAKLGWKVDGKTYKVTGKLPLTTFSSVQNAVDYASAAIDRLNELCAEQVNAFKLDPKKGFDAKTAARIISTVSVVVKVAPGTYEGFTVSDMNLFVVGNYDVATKKLIRFDPWMYGDSDIDYIYTEIGKGKGGSVVSASGGIVRISNLVITGGKNNVGGGIYMDDVYGQIINCYVEGNSAAYGAAIGLNNCKKTIVSKNMVTNNKVLVKGKAGGAIFVMGGEEVEVRDNRIAGNKAVNGLSSGLAIYRGKKNKAIGNWIINNIAAPGYPNFQMIIGGAIKTEDDETSKVTGLVVDGNILLGMYRTNKTKYAMSKNEYGIAEEIGENGFIDLYGHKLINNLFVKGTLNYVYRNSIGTRQFKNISIENFEDINNPDNTGSQAISKRNRNETVLYRDGWSFPRKISGTDLRKKLYPKIDAPVK